LEKRNNKPGLSCQQGKSRSPTEKNQPWGEKVEKGGGGYCSYKKRQRLRPDRVGENKKKKAKGGGRTEKKNNKPVAKKDNTVRWGKTMEEKGANRKIKLSKSDHLVQGNGPPEQIRPKELSVCRERKRTLKISLTQGSCHNRNPTRNACRAKTG